MSTPNMLMRFLPTGLLGLGLTALLASLMSSLAAGLTAFNTVFTCDLYQSCIRKAAPDRHYLAVGRWAAVGGILSSIGVAYAILGFNHPGSHGIALDTSPFDNILGALLLVKALHRPRRILGPCSRDRSGPPAPRPHAGRRRPSRPSGRMDCRPAHLPRLRRAVLLDGDLRLHRKPRRRVGSKPLDPAQTGGGTRRPGPLPHAPADKNPLVEAPRSPCGSHPAGRHRTKSDSRLKRDAFSLTR
jgi:hypothetical protein